MRAKPFYWTPSYPSLGINHVQTIAALTRRPPRYGFIMAHMSTEAEKCHRLSQVSWRLILVDVIQFNPKDLRARGADSRNPSPRPGERWLGLSWQAGQREQILLSWLLVVPRPSREVHPYQAGPLLC
jgi:hypothetical protein